MLKPFQILWELIEFALQALFLWVLAIILCVGIIAGVIYDKKQQEPEVQIIYKDPIQEMTVAEEPSELVCTRIEGCETFKNAKTPEQYCPTCEWR